MRLWSLHPSLLDAKGLVALWREALLAQVVLSGRTKGYRKHPQLIRFRESPRPLQAIARYLYEVHREAARRGYHFDLKKIQAKPNKARLCVTRGQLEFEIEHLKRKLMARGKVEGAARQMKIVPHPLFRVIRGGVAARESPARPKGRSLLPNSKFSENKKNEKREIV